MRTLDQRRSATLPQPTATAPPSLAETIQSAVAKQITDELQGELSRKKKAAVQPAHTGSAIPEKSIAVLPFDNLSRDPDNAYFCEGMQDEILTRLASIADLKVISRTSTQHFKSTPDNLPRSRSNLAWRTSLEGSVQKTNDQVRVNVQLINALTDAHLWAETLRSEIDRYLCGRERDRENDCRYVTGEAERFRTACDRRATHREYRSAPALFEGTFLLEQAHR